MLLSGLWKRSGRRKIDVAELCELLARRGTQRQVMQDYYATQRIQDKGGSRGEKIFFKKESEKLNKELCAEAPINSFKAGSVRNEDAEDGSGILRRGEFRHNALLNMKIHLARK
jgi:hypothetical protein